MAVVNFAFRVLNAVQAGVTSIVFGTTVGSSPGIDSIKQLPASVGGVATNIVTPTISFIEIGRGLYMAQFDVEAIGADVELMLDAGVALGADAYRYIPVMLNRDSSRLLAGVPVAATGLDALLTDVTSPSDGRSSGFKMLRYLFDFTLNKEAGTSGVRTIYNDAGVAIGTMALSDDSVTFTREKAG